MMINKLQTSPIADYILKHKRYPDELQMIWGRRKDAYMAGSTVGKGGMTQAVFLSRCRGKVNPNRLGMTELRPSSLEITQVWIDELGDDADERR